MRDFPFLWMGELRTPAYVLSPYMCYEVFYTALGFDLALLVKLISLNPICKG